jgi:hypothetical protein
MRNSQLSKSVKVGIPVEAIALFFMAFSLESVASTGPSWSSQPSWADPDTTTTTPSRRSQIKDTYKSTNLSPFAPGTSNLALDVGQVFLMGDMSKYSDAIGSQVHYTYGVSDLFGFDSSLGYSSHSNGQFSMATLLTGLRTNLAWYDKVVPYMVFGMGFYRPSYQLAPDASGNSTSLSPVLFGVHVGPGIDLALTRQIFFGASLTFHDMFGGQEIVSPGVTQSVGGSFVSFLVHTGITF